MRTMDGVRAWLETGVDSAHRTRLIHLPDCRHYIDAIGISTVFELTFLASLPNVPGGSRELFRDCNPRGCRNSKRELDEFREFRRSAADRFAPLARTWYISL
jgi:hypothetical protein